jgi:hypothetical protein
MLSTLTSAYRAERTARPVRAPRIPLLVRVGRLAARVLPRWKQFRTTVLHLAGFGLLTAAAWTIALPLGLAAGGLSLLVLDYLAGER